MIPSGSRFYQPNLVSCLGEHRPALYHQRRGQL